MRCRTLLCSIRLKMVILLTIALQPAIQTPALAGAYGYQQDAAIVKGTVTDDQGEPLVGAQVIIKGTANGTVCDVDGNFALRANSEDVLVVSFIGFATQEIQVGNSTNLSIRLQESARQLAEVVVTGFQTLSKDKATGSYQSVTGPALQQRPTQNILDKLEGMVSGLSVNVYEDGRVGRVEVRGRNTIYANTSPLYVVDGFPIQGDIETINPEDIESLYVLSDAAAAAQWGVRASNGVIVITTKKAKKNSGARVDFSSFYAIDEAIDFGKMDWMNPAQEAALHQEYIDKGWYSFPTMISDGDRELNQIMVANIYKDGLSPDGNIWSQQTYDNYINNMLSKGDAADQYEQYLYRNGTHQTYNLSVTASTENNSIYSSIVFNDDKMKEIGDDKNRIIFNIRDRFEVNDNLGFTASMNAGMRKETQNGLAPFNVMYERSYDQLVDEFGNTIQYYNAYNPWVSRQRESEGYLPYGFNQLDEVRNTDKTFEQVDLRAQFGMDYEIIPGLRFETKYQYEKGYENFDDIATTDRPSHRILVNDLYLGGDEYQIPLGARYTFSRREMFSWNWRNTLSYEKIVGEHDFSILSGFDIRKNFTEYLTDKVYGYDPQTTTSVPVNQKDFQGGAIFDWNGDRRSDSYFRINNTDIREIGFYFMPGYTFRDKYTVNANYRVDQRNLFGSDPNFRYKPLWSIGASWQISKESFMGGLDWVDRLILKTSYGLTGNASNNYSPFAKATPSVRFWGAGLYDYLYLSQPANPQLKWEETMSFNIATEFNLFGNRLRGTISYYNESSKDLLGSKPLDPTNGFTSAVVNYASVSNNGIEMNVNGTVVEVGDFSVNAGLNFNYNKNRITSIDDPQRTAQYHAWYGVYKEGEPIENLYSYNYAGLNEFGEPMIYDIDGEKKSWREGVDDVNELIYWGTRVAPIYGGGQITIGWKGLDLSMNLVYKAGYYFKHYTYPGKYGESRRLHESWADRWMEPGDENTTNIPKIAYNGTNPHSGLQESLWDSYDGDWFYQDSQEMIFKGDFIKIRDLILGYTMPQSIIGNTPVRSLRFTAQVTNPYHWYANERGVDPENRYGRAYTNLKTLTLGVRAQF